MRQNIFGFTKYTVFVLISKRPIYLKMSEWPTMTNKKKGKGGYSGMCAMEGLPLSQIRSKIINCAA
jgi:hypothetical protein